MAMVRHKGQQSQTEKEFCEILRMADPIVSRFVSEHEALKRRNEALLERVAVLERALEEIASHSEFARVGSTQDVLTRLAQDALDG